METIKEEKKADLEQLLNRLVEAGWKPRGLLNEIEYIHAFDDVNQGWSVEISYGDHGYYKSLRQIVSKESGLWQFVCENGMVKGDEGIYWHKNGGGISDLRTYDYEFENFWLIEASLRDERGLEDFLLDNIMVNVKGD